MAVISSLVPGFGLFGSVVQYITSEDPKAENRVLLDIASSGLGDGFVTNFLTGVAKELYFGSQVAEATTQLTPQNLIALRCNKCSRITNFYVRNSSRITCNNCLSQEVSSRVNSDDRIFVLQNGIYRIHNEIYQTNLKNNREINNEGINNYSLDNKFI